VGLLNNEIQNEIGDKGKPNTRLLQEIADALAADDRKDFVDALHDKSISAQVLATVLKRRGFVVSSSTISLYRRGGLSYEVR
jgi:hypothetical protein